MSIRTLRSVLAAVDAVARRLLDLTVAAMLLLLLAPLLLVVAIAIAVDSPGPVFYRCRRAGQGGGAFRMLKFRKMPVEARGPALTLAGDARFTRVGRFLAPSKLDELPQLWNVLRGEMSLVGPRPEDPKFVRLLSREYEDVLRARPGITGLCQLAFAREGEILDPADPEGDYVERLLPQKIAMDRLYTAQCSFLANLRILRWTVVAVVLRKPVAVDRRNGRLSRRRRPIAVAAPAEAQEAQA